MSNPPLSLLSDDLVDYLVEHVARLPGVFSNRALHNLSLADPAFTEACQKYLFRTLTLGGKGGTRSKISKRLTVVKSILDDKPLLANRVRKIDLFIEHKQNAWLFQNSTRENPRRKDAAYAITFISILQLLANSPRPPHQLHLYVVVHPIENPVLVVERLSQSFFSETLTILHLTRCNNVPLPLFLLSPRLKEVCLDRVGAAEGGYDKYPEEQCSGRVMPALELFDYRGSQTVVKQMITPPRRFHAPVVLWSKLRVLTLCPHEREEMACLQSILDAACTALEELYLTNLYVGLYEPFPLAGLVNLSGLLRLRAFALDTEIECDAPEFAVLRDINIVLHTIPASNSITNLWFDFSIFDEDPFHGCLDEDWVGICNEVIRISSGQPLELDIGMSVHTGTLEDEWRKDKLYEHLIGRVASLSAHPEICTHLWNPLSGLGPSPRGQVRNRCRR